MQRETSGADHDPGEDHSVLGLLQGRVRAVTGRRVSDLPFALSVGAVIFGADIREFQDVSFERLSHSTGATSTTSIIFDGVPGGQLAASLHLRGFSMTTAFVLVRMGAVQIPSRSQ